MSDPTTTPTAAEQGTHHYLLTLQASTPTGFFVQTWSGSLTPPTGATRQDVCSALRAQFAASEPLLAKNAVLFFDVQPNQL